MKSLRNVDVQETSVTAEGAAQLQRLKPTCVLPDEEEVAYAALLGYDIRQSRGLKVSCTAKSAAGDREQRNRD
jgi:hypothetical protein